MAEKGDRGDRGDRDDRDEPVTADHCASLLSSALAEWAEYPPGDRSAPSPEETRRARGIGDSALAYLRSAADPLPAFPAVASRALLLASDPDVEIAELVQLVNGDPGIAAQILRTANSAFYARGKTISSIAHAVSVLGLSKIAQIMAVTSLRTLYDPQVKAGQRQFLPLWKALWHHSVVSAYASLETATSLRCKDPSDAFIGGLLHDIGKLGALQALGGLFYLGRYTAQTTSEVEDVLEVMHLEVGEEMAKTWKLPPHVAAVVKEHHAVALASTPESSPLHVIRVVSGLNQMRLNPRYRQGLDQEIESSAAALRLDEAALSRIGGAIRAAEAQAAALFSIQAPNQ